jgi:3-hydroxyacyl-CoA dehydrogenase
MADRLACFTPATGCAGPVPTVAGHAGVAEFRRTHRVVHTNPGASLVDLGDDIACIELYSMQNAIGSDILSAISTILNPTSDAVRDFAGFVVSGDRENFAWAQT